MSTDNDPFTEALERGRARLARQQSDMARLLVEPATTDDPFTEALERGREQRDARQAALTARLFDEPAPTERNH